VQIIGFNANRAGKIERAGKITTRFQMLHLIDTGLQAGDAPLRAKEETV
jgi:hypothetical protein